MQINPDKNKSVSFTRAPVKDSLNYFWGEQRITEASSANI
jgi:hypothetical protein